MPLPIKGSRGKGADVRTENVMAVQSIANVVRSSLGPVGLDKMLVDQMGDIKVTNDGATILAQLDVEHPAGKVLVDLARLQDEEVGDGTTTVVLLAAELCRRANELVKQKIHPTSIITGLRLASKEAVRFIKEEMSMSADTLGRECLINAAATSMSSKIIGAQARVFTELAVDAVLGVKTVNRKGKTRYPIKSINVLKSQGKSAADSELLDGYALNCTKASQAMPQCVKDAKIALLDINLAKQKLKMGVQVLVENPDDLEEIRAREIDITKERIQRILDAGANVVLTTKGIDDTAMKYLVERGVMGVRRCKKEDLKKIAKATGGTLIASLVDMEGNESFDAAYLGEAAEVAEERVSDRELIFIRGCKDRKSHSIILRGPSEVMLEEIDRSLHDVLCVVKRVLESNKVVPGGGAVEAALSIYLEKFATTLGSREQLAIAEFAEALLIIPKTLTVNAAQDATDLVAKLRAHHNASQTDESKKALAHSGLDLRRGVIRNNVEAGVLEPAMSKVKSIQFATEAAITILRIDDHIKIMKPEPQQQGGHGH